MAQESKKKIKALRKVVMVIFGVVLIVLGMLAIIVWWDNLWLVAKGCAGLILFLAGVGVISLSKK
ncbi:MAG: hypothetical protein ABIH71_07865 [Candidatus Omnitrophota bacterium]|nr:hypothetical protein [Candidatus Omnitrophota bacterium]